jgi:hypothetical protein
MKHYEGLNQKDWQIIQIAVKKMEIKGADAYMISNLLAKINLEVELLNLPEAERPKKGDLITKE